MKYTNLTSDTLAWAIATDLLVNPEDHSEFLDNWAGASEYEELVSMVEEDIRDMVSNSNEDDWLLCFYDNDGSLEPNGYRAASREMTNILLNEGYDSFEEYAESLWELAEKVTTIYLKMKAGIPGRFVGVGEE